MTHRTFEILPANGADFAPLAMDVPVLTDSEHDAQRAARRCYFSAMSLLAGQGFDVEDFTVREGTDGTGRKVGAGGFEGFAPIPAAECETCAKIDDAFENGGSFPLAGCPVHGESL